MNDVELLEVILKTVREKKITAYEIAKHTDLSAFAIQKILDGDTKKPYRNTLLKILDYLESRIVGTKMEAADASETYSINPIRKKVPIEEIFTDVGTELILAYKGQIKLYEENASLYRKNASMLEEKIASYAKA
jgi:predicted transcriptional regulator